MDGAAESEEDKQFTLFIEVENLYGAELSPDEQDVWKPQTLELRAYDRDTVNAVLKRIETDHSIPADKARLVKDGRVLEGKKSLRKQGIENKDNITLQDSLAADALAVRDDLYRHTRDEYTGFHLCDPHLGSDGEFLDTLFENLKVTFEYLLQQSDTKNVKYLRKAEFWMKAVGLIAQCPHPFAWFLLQESAGTEYVDYDDIKTSTKEHITWDGFKYFWLSQLHAFRAPKEEPVSPKEENNKGSVPSLPEAQESKDANIPAMPTREPLKPPILVHALHPRQLLSAVQLASVEGQLVKYRNLTSKHPSDPWNWMNLGICHQILGEPSAAVAAFQEIGFSSILEGTDEQTGLLLWRIAIAHEEAGDPDMASAWLKRALTTELKDPVFYIDAGTTYWRMGRGWSAVWYWHQSVWRDVSMEYEAVAMLAASLLAMSNASFRKGMEEDGLPECEEAAMDPSLVSTKARTTPEYGARVPRPLPRPMAIPPQACRALGLSLLRVCMREEVGTEKGQDLLSRWGIAQAQAGGKLLDLPWMEVHDTIKDALEAAGMER